MSNKTGQTRFGPKQSYEPAVKLYLNITLKTMSVQPVKEEKKLCAQIREGIFPLHTETGRYVGLEEDSRIWTMCDLKEIKNKFLFYAVLFTGKSKGSFLMLITLIDFFVSSFFFLFSTKAWRGTGAGN